MCRSISARPRLDPKDDYPLFVIPLARAVARGEVTRGIAVCGSGVGACIAANKVKGVRAALITDNFSAHQGVEDDDMNVLCLGGHVVGFSLARELVMTFLGARFKGCGKIFAAFGRNCAAGKRGEKKMKKNPLLGIREFGQSIWLDYIRRKMIDSGELKRLIEEDGLRGITSNPSIFEKAIGESEDYDDQIPRLGPGGEKHGGNLSNPHGERCSRRGRLLSPPL